MPPYPCRFLLGICYSLTLSHRTLYGYVFALFLVVIQTVKSKLSPTAKPHCSSAYTYCDSLDSCLPSCLTSVIISFSLIGTWDILLSPCYPHNISQRLHRKGQCNPQVHIEGEYFDPGLERSQKPPPFFFCNVVSKNRIWYLFFLNVVYF